jgi:hypothetical protein
VDRILKKDEKLLVQKYVGNSRIVRLNFKNKKTIIVLEILQLLHDSDDFNQVQRKINRIKENNVA